MLTDYQTQIFSNIIAELQKKSSIALQHFNIYSNTEGNINKQLAGQYQEECELLQTIVLSLTKIKEDFINSEKKPHEMYS